MAHPLFDKHRETLDRAVDANAKRTFFSAYPEIPSGRIYGESARKDAQTAHEATLGKPFDLDQPGQANPVGQERSPYGPELGVTYPGCDPDALLPAMQHAIPAWRDAGVEARVGTCLEILHRLNRRSFEIANAVMHTTGQAFMMAFQAGGPHAQDRGLEALAEAYAQMTRIPESVTWTKPVGKDTFATLTKQFKIIPRGVALVIGCSTFPTWNTYPALLANLATGNAVIVKPHPGAILPLAITVQTGRDVLREAGFDPNLLTLACDAPDAPITQTLALRPEVRIIDYTGGSAFGDWLESNARQAVVFTEKAGVNSIILDSVDDLKAAARNIAFTLSLYSGQMCTTPQNIFIPEAGIRTADGTAGLEDVAGAIIRAIDGLLSDPARAVEVLGAIQNEATWSRVDQAASEGGEILRASQPITHERFPEARCRTPLLLKASADQCDRYMREMFGPISYLISTADTADSINRAAHAARTHGAITCSAYSMDTGTRERIADAMADTGTPVSFNLTGPIFVNQSAAFSDYHVSGANPAGNATLSDAAYVANRFRVAQTKTPA